MIGIVAVSMNVVLQHPRFGTGWFYKKEQSLFEIIGKPGFGPSCSNEAIGSVFTRCRIL
jgi:hypothetical protein